MNPMDSADEALSTSTSVISEENSTDGELVTEGDRNAKHTKQTEIKPLNGDWHACKTVRLDTTQSLESEAIVVRIAPDCAFCAVGLANGDIRLFHLNNRSTAGLTVRLKDPEETLPCTDIRFFHEVPSKLPGDDHCILCSYASGLIRLWNCTIASGKKALKTSWKESSFKDCGDSTKDESNQILCLSVSYDNQRFITGGTDAYVRVYDRSVNSEGRILKPTICSYKASGHTSRITALAYHPRGKTDNRYLPIFVSAGWDDSIQIWHDKQGSSLWQIYGPHVAGNDGLDIDPIRNVIISCSWRREDSLVQTWSFPEFLIQNDESITDQEKAKFKRPAFNFVYEPNQQTSQGYVAKYDDSYRHILYAGSNKNLINILDVENNAVVAEIAHLNNGVYSGAIFRDSQLPNQLMLVYTNGKGVSLGKIKMTGY